MTSRKITTTIGSVAGSVETTWNRLIMGIRARHMPKSIKKMKKTILGKQQVQRPDLDHGIERHDDATDKVSYFPKYMGSTLIEELVDPEPGANYYNTGLSTKALDRIVKMTRNNNLVEVALNISTRNIQLVRLSDRATFMEVTMDKVAFCVHDKKYSKLVSFICRNSVNDTMECHAFLCDRQKMAKAITTAIARIHRKSLDTTELSGDNSNRGDQEGSELNGDTGNSDTGKHIAEAKISLSSNFGARNSLTNGQANLLMKKSSEARNSDNQPRLLELDDLNSSNTQDMNLSVTPSTLENTTPSQDLDFLQDISSNGGMSHQSAVLTHENSTNNNRENRHSVPLIVDDDLLPPVARGRADSDSWAVMASGTGYDSSNVDLELEFSK